MCNIQVYLMYTMHASTHAVDEYKKIYEKQFKHANDDVRQRVWAPM